MRIEFLLQKIKEVKQAKLEENGKNLLILKLTNIFIRLQNRLEYFSEDLCYEVMSINYSIDNLKEALEIYENLEAFFKKSHLETNEKNKELVQQIRQKLLEQTNFTETVNRSISNYKNDRLNSKVNSERLHKWKELLPSIILSAVVTVLIVVFAFPDTGNGEAEDSTKAKLTIKYSYKTKLRC